MRTLLLITTLLFLPHPARAEQFGELAEHDDFAPRPALDAGAPAGPVVSLPSVTPPAGDNFGALDNPAVYLRGFYTSVRAGNYFEAAALLVIAVMGLLRLGGKRLHEQLADDSPWDRPLWFIFDTKPGRILHLCLTTSAAGVGGAWLLGQHIDIDLVKPIVLTTFTASTLYGWAKDFLEWFKARPQGAGP